MSKFFAALAQWCSYNAGPFGLAGIVNLYSHPHTLFDTIETLGTCQASTQGGISVGDRVHLLIVDTDETLTVTLVHHSKHWDNRHELSVYSPLGIALLGKNVGSSVTIPIFRSQIGVRVLDVERGHP